jgi:hypothetical protein
VTTIGSTSTTLSNYAGSAYGSASTTAATATTTTTSDTETATQNTDATSVTLSEEAKAYLASTTAATATTTTTTTATTTPKTAAELAATARKWFDQQYKTLDISAAMQDGRVTVDFTDQDRATLSAIASNTGNLFSQDEIKAATLVLQARFDDEIGPFVAVARLTRDYASVYEAAQDYLDEAGADEKATPLWKAQTDALTEGLAAAKATPGKAPDTGNPDDPVRSLLDRTSNPGAALPGTSFDDVASAARSMLDAQINKAADEGTELVFSAGRRTGQQVDYGDFDNRSLAAVAQNQGDAFSAEEVRTAKTELDRRNRESILAAMQTSESSGDARSNSLALLQQYAGMSTEERSAMGYTEAFAERIAQNYRTLTMLQNAVSQSGSSGLAGLLG